MANREMEFEDATVVVHAFEDGAFFADRYRILGLLGKGGMGRVYSALELSSDRIVALKILHPDKAQNPRTLARFQREAEIMNKVGHPGVIQIVDSGTSPDGVAYLAMELLRGQPLSTYLKKHERLTPEAWMPYLLALCDALAAAHSQAVVHRDLKPDNIFVPLSGTGLVKVLDFGLSHLATAERMTRTGTLIGTPRYMAPEQIREAGKVDPRVDVYAIGVITYEALAGKSPFRAKDYRQLLGAVIKGTWVPLDERMPELPRGVVEVVHRAMARDKTERFSTMGDFGEAYATALGHASVELTPGSGSFMWGDASVSLALPLEKLRAGFGPDDDTTLIADPKEVQDAVRRAEERKRQGEMVRSGGFPAHHEATVPETRARMQAQQTPGGVHSSGAHSASPEQGPAAGPAAPPERKQSLLVFAILAVLVMAASAGVAIAIRQWMHEHSDATQQDSGPPGQGQPAPIRVGPSASSP